MCPDRVRCCWEWRCISGGFRALQCHWSKELPVAVTAKSPTLRGTVWPGVSSCSDRSILEYLLSCTCPGAWSAYLFMWQREYSISTPSHLGIWESPTGSHIISIWFGQLLERKGVHGEELCYNLCLFPIGMKIRTYLVNTFFFLRTKEIKEGRGISPREVEEGLWQVNVCICDFFM